MTVNFRIQSPPPVAITSSATLPDVVALSTEEIRSCFPSRVVMAENDRECIALEDAPVIGVLVEISGLWLQLRRGAVIAEAVDFYGEYKLVLREMEGFIECKDEFSGDECLVPRKMFAVAARQWSGEVFAAVERRYLDIGRNTNYQHLKAFVSDAWHDGIDSE